MGMADSLGALECGLEVPDHVERADERANRRAATLAARAAR